MTNNDISTATDAATPDFEKGSWQSTLKRSSDLQAKAGADRKKASLLLWEGAKAGISEWEINDASNDVSGENLYNDVLAALGKSRKGDASKIRTVAAAVRNHGLALAAYPNLSKAYAEATRLTKTQQAEAAEDLAALQAIAALAADAPNSASTPENAAKIVVSRGLDEAARLLLDALGTDEQVHRAFLRAIAQELAGRKPATAPKKAASTGPKTGATKATATPGSNAKAAVVKTGKTKAAPVKAEAPAKAEAVAAPVKTKTKAAPVKAEAPAEAPAKAEAVAAPVKAKTKAAPVIKRG